MLKTLQISGPISKYMGREFPFVLKFIENCCSHYTKCYDTSWEYNYTLTAANYRTVFLTVVNYRSLLCKLQLTVVAIWTYSRTATTVLHCTFTKKNFQTPSKPTLTKINQILSIKSQVSIINPFSLHCSLYRVFFFVNFGRMLVFKVNLKF